MNIKEEIIGAIDILVDSAIKKICPIITFGICIAVNTKSKCTIKINNKDIQISYYGESEPKINHKYPVFVPFNNMSLAFIITGNKEKNQKYSCEVYYNGSGETSFTSKVIFNTIISNIGNCYDNSTGYFTCPVDGVYAVNFLYYSGSTSTTQRPAIMINDIMHFMTNGSYGNTISGSIYCQAGDKISAGAYDAGFPISLSATNGYNYFSVCLIYSDEQNN